MIRFAPVMLALAGSLAMAGGMTTVATAAVASEPDDAAPTAMSYGPDPAQTLDLYRGDAQFVRPLPLVVFVHGGAWQHGDKNVPGVESHAPFFTGQGYHYASIGYRLVPDVTVEQQAGDVAHALAFLLADARRLGIDPDDVVLMGHSAGAHLVALVGTDPRYLLGAGLSMDAVKGVIAIDGAAYDATRASVGNKWLARKLFEPAFGTDPARQAALSPISYAAKPNVAHFLLLHVERPEGIAQAEMLESALADAGSDVTRLQFPGKGMRGHAHINRALGEADYPPTLAVKAWLKTLFGR